MKCPRCPGRMEVGATCPECGWKPVDLLEEALRNIGLIKDGAFPGITDLDAAAKSAAYQGAGTGYALAKLGLITGQEWLEWTKRLNDAAGIPYEPISRSMRFSTEAVAEKPTGAMLFSGELVRKPHSLRGVYVDRRPQREVRARFAYAEPDRYRWLTDDGEHGLVSDGRTHAVVRDGAAALVAAEGEVAITHRFGNLLSPSSFDVAGWELGEPAVGTIEGRDAWIVESRTSLLGKAPTVAAFDQETGILLSMEGGDQRIALEELEVNPSLDKEIFEWHGPIATRPMGVAYLSFDKSWSVSWQIRFAKLAASYHVSDMTFGSKDEATAWAAERAVETVITSD